MAKPTTVIGRALAFSVPAALGIGAVLYAGAFRSLPDALSAQRPPTPVRVITVAPIELVPSVSGYGAVEPVREWRAVARVAGEVVEMADGLAAGQIVTAGTPLFRIDDSDLRLDLAGVDAQIAASEVKDDTIGASLALALSDLELARGDLGRQEQLSRQGAATQAALDTAKRQEVSARTKVKDLENQLLLNAAERAVLGTQRARLERALGFAEIRAPYDLRITDLAADLGQYVGSGQTLLSAEGTEAVEIAALFPIGRIGPLLRLMGEGAAVTDLTARVTLPAPGHAVSWPATIARVGDAIDPQTQSVGVVVRVSDPLSKSAAGKRPPLRRNMVVEVQLAAPKRETLVVPAEAVRGGSALVVSAEATLETRPVEIALLSGEIAVPAKGLAAGDLLVITDPSVAVPGMTVKPVEDKARKDEIAALASGQNAAPAKTGGGKGGQGGEVSK
ncbi:efflux RND transporter periplasmic adaptor subunit [bacterium]|nr:efflux RND transporter periplasmic adaptor subunit [bacterium]